MAQPGSDVHHHAAHDEGEHAGHVTAWEGSAEGIAYSEFNHHLTGWFVVLLGAAELAQALLRGRFPFALRLLLPGALMMTGLFLLVWSDHEAWPIGSMSLTQTLFGGDHEVVQHKAYGLLALLIGGIEAFRRTGRLRHAGWLMPLPAFAIVGGWMLFGHSHGTHPAAQTIAWHHAIMGALAVTAGSSKLVSVWNTRAEGDRSSRWDLLWASLILLIGLELTLYTE
jgi:putative copper resistance protein D